jgi:tetratricopeptide (TPR) repeat protein
LLAFIHSSTEGNPFFIEELFQHLLETGKLTEPSGEFRSTLDLADIDVPQSVRLVIGRRLARLSDETRKILSTAAAIGHSFTFELLEASARADADPLLDCIEEAERAGLVFSTLQRAEALFQFSHELIRQTVLGDLSAPRRQQLHLHIAEAIERLYPNAFEDHVSDLAHHLWQAGNAADVDKTVRYLAKAAKSALAQSAYDDSIHHLQNALDLLKKLPDSQECARSELRLQMMLTVPLIAIKGYAAREIEDACNRARELCGQIGQTPHLFGVLGGLCSVYFSRAELQTANEYANQMVHLAQTKPDPVSLLWAHYTLGVVLWAQGELVSARAQLGQSLAFYDFERSQSYGFVQDPGATGLARLAHVLWSLGYPDEALRKSDEAVALARKLSHPYSLAWVLGEAAAIHWMRGESAEHLQTQRIALATEYGHVRQMAWGTIGRGLDLVERGQQQKGIAQVDRGLAECKGTGLELECLTLLAGAYRKVGRPVEGLAVLAEALKVMNKTGYRCNLEAELHRLNGELLAMQGMRRATQRPSALFAPQLMWRSRRGLSLWNFARRPASHDCFAIPAAVTKRARCSPRSTAGSRRASIPPT